MEMERVRVVMTASDCPASFVPEVSGNDTDASKTAGHCH